MNKDLFFFLTKGGHEFNILPKFKNDQCTEYRKSYKIETQVQGLEESETCAGND
jgi:hypothetical protein